MSGFVFKLRAAPAERLDLSRLIPSRLATLSDYDIAQIEIAADGTRTGDVFTISGSAGDTVTIDGGSARLDFVGAGLDGGTLIVEGETGAYAGTGMSGGRLDIRGNAGAWLATGMKDGLITVKGSVGDFVGGPRTGDKQGMAGGTVIVEGNAGERAGDRMRRGTIIVRGTIGPAAASRMMGGTLLTETGFGASPGPLLRRGTLIGPKVDRMLPTFADCGRHDLRIVPILNRYFAETLGALAPKALPRVVRRFLGDQASIGKGEIILTA
jgi:formylmethanofuran dehydrogenase subunit C